MREYNAKEIKVEAEDSDAGQPNESIFILTNLANGGVSGVQQSPF
uniref:Uncharacterized protein n=1 Tax=Candidatus Kentrum eta TaxID=2126337 RepID=A0A450VL72_9GAMM|nr:MAG: hypothetical protein BECKH772B_GA0070898_105971 [Candidatus Kentron sp. H]VFK09857.1 MAG: hypothetical protein BECKH772C_GA0070978_106511 [Candidatus Kentron sp. H]